MLSPRSQGVPTGLNPRGALQRNAALAWIADNAGPDWKNDDPAGGVIFFAEDDYTFSLDLFEVIRDVSLARSNYVVEFTELDEIPEFDNIWVLVQQAKKSVVQKHKHGQTGQTWGFRPALALVIHCQNTGLIRYFAK